MRLYDTDGKLVRKKNASDTFFYLDDNLVPVPWYNSDKSDIINFLYACMKDVVSDVTVDEILKAWKYYEDKQIIIITYFIALKSLYNNLRDKRRE